MTRMKNAFAILIIVCPGCAIGDSASDFAMIEVNRLARCIARLSANDCEQVETLSEALDIAVSRGWATPETRKSLRDRDFWGNPYLFERKVHEDRIVIRIISKGENGAFENGAGDDITAQVTIPKQGSNTWNLTFKGKTVSRD